MTETATTTATGEQTHNRPLISARNRKRLLILTFWPALGSLAMWLVLWLPVNLAHGNVTWQGVRTIIVWHSLLFNGALLVPCYEIARTDGGEGSEVGE